MVAPGAVAGERCESLIVVTTRLACSVVTDCAGSVMQSPGFARVSHPSFSGRFPCRTFLIGVGE